MPRSSDAALPSCGPTVGGADHGLRLVKCVVFPSPAWHREPLDPQISTLSSSALADAMCGLNIVDAGIRRLGAPVPDQEQPNPRRVGRAVTVRTLRGDHYAVRTAIASTGPGDVLVIDGQGDQGRAIWGGLLSERVRARGVVAVVVDGAAREPAEIGAAGLPVYARATTPVPSTGLGPGYVNVPVVIGGVIVYPSDVIVADDEAIVVIPARDVEQVVTFAASKMRSEAGVVAAVRANEATARHPLPIEAPSMSIERRPWSSETGAPGCR